MALRGKRIFITGGAGFIGTTLARRLVDANEIVAVDNLHRDALSGTDLPEHPNFTLHQGDVLDADLMTELAAGATHVVHCAAIAGVDTVLESPVRTMRVNMIGTYNVLEAALATRESVERLVEFHLADCLGAFDQLVDGSAEEAAGEIDDEQADQGDFHRSHQEDAVFHGGDFVVDAFEAALAGRELTIHGDGSQIRAWCYVDDMVEALLLALENPAAVGHSFNIGNARSTVTIYDLALRIKRLTGCPGEIVFQPLHYTDVELRIPNVDKARELLGFEAQVELDEGLERTIAWYRSRRPALT